MKEFKDKYTEMKAIEKKLEADATRDNAHITKISDEINKFKIEYRQMLVSTGFNPVEDRVISKPNALPGKKRTLKGKRTGSKNEEDDETARLVVLLCQL